MTNYPGRTAPPYSAVDRAWWRGWVFKPISDMVTMIAERRHFLAAVRVRPRTPAEQRKAIEPMLHGERALAYLRQNAMDRPFTPRQRARMRRKCKVGGRAYARGERG